MSRSIEEWRPVVGYEGLYEVSDWGRVKSLDRVVECYSKLTNTFFKRYFKSEIKSTCLDKDCYEMVNLKKNGKHKTEKVHRLVAKAFIPNHDKKPYIDHINGIRFCNYVWNLRWCTQFENLNTSIAKANLSIAQKINAVKRNRNGLGQFTS